MTTPIGRSAPGAMLLGHRYQHTIAWRQALRALAPGSTTERFGVEARDAYAYDDVVTSGPAESAYQQAKFVVDGTAGFTLDWLTTGYGQKNQSMAQRALTTFERLSAYGAVSLALFTNRELDAESSWLGAYRSADATIGMAARRLLAGERSDDAALQALEKLRNHLGCDSEAFLRLLDAWQLRWSHSLPDAEEMAQAQMRAHGLRDTPDALAAGVGFIHDMVTRGVREIAIADLAERIDSLALRASPAMRVLSVSAVDVDPHRDIASVAIDVQAAFAGRRDEAARGLDDWGAVDAQLEAAVARLGTPSQSPVLIHAAARLPVWFRLGTLMRQVQGWTVACEHSGELYPSDGALQQSSSLHADMTGSGEGSGDDLIVIMSATYDIRGPVSRHLEHSSLQGARRLSLTLEPTGPAAIDGPAHARRTAADIKREVLTALEAHPADRVHLFMAAPKAIALLLGHSWHRLALVTMYEDLGPGRGYQPAFTVGP
jgi:hypothetical protein